LEELRKPPPIVSGLAFALLFVGLEASLPVILKERRHSVPELAAIFVFIYMGWFAKWGLFRAIGRRILAKENLEADGYEKVSAKK
jgi:hypothetical protein